MKVVTGTQKHTTTTTTQQKPPKQMPPKKTATAAAAVDNSAAVPRSTASPARASGTAPARTVAFRLPLVGALASVLVIFLVIGLAAQHPPCDPVKPLAAAVAKACNFHPLATELLRAVDAVVVAYVPCAAKVLGGAATFIVVAHIFEAIVVLRRLLALRASHGAEACAVPVLIWSVVSVFIVGKFCFDAVKEEIAVVKGYKKKGE